MAFEAFEQRLTAITAQLQRELRTQPFTEARQFEQRVRAVAAQHFGADAIESAPAAQAFPDIAVAGTGAGIEVKFTTHDTWRSVANSVLETNRVAGVDKVYLLFGKMGGTPQVRWADYASCVMHVRTSHVPRFEVDLETSHSLFAHMGIAYDEFRLLDMHQKMEYIRRYARARLGKGERVWWLEDAGNESHSLPLQARLYTHLQAEEKNRLRAEGLLLCPQIVASGRARHKYDDMVLYLLTYHGVLCHQARDLFSAGSVANPDNADHGGIYIQKAIALLQPYMREAAQRMDDALFVEYWGQSVRLEQRIRQWLLRADRYAKGWVPSRSLFLTCP